MNLRGKFTTGADGRFRFRSVMMAGYPIPTDGVVGPPAEAAAPASLPAGASARADFQAGIQGVDFPGL